MEGTETMKMMAKAAIRNNITTQEKLFDTNDHLEILYFLGKRWGEQRDVGINQCLDAFEELMAIRQEDAMRKYREMKNSITQAPSRMLSK